MNDATPTPTPTPPSALDAAEARLRAWLRGSVDYPAYITGAKDVAGRIADDALAVIDGLRAQLAEARAERDGLAKIAAGYKLQLDVGFQHIERTPALSDDDKIKELRARVIELEDDLEAAVAVHEDNEAATADEHRQREKHMADLAAAHSQVAALLAERGEMAGDLGHARQAYDGDQMWNDMAESWSARLRAPLKPKGQTP